MALNVILFLESLSSASFLVIFFVMDLLHFLVLFLNVKTALSYFGLLRKFCPHNPSIQGLTEMRA